MNRAEWLAARKTGLGASDAAAVLGLSPWSTPLQVYLDKTGESPERPMTAPQEWGLRLEPVVAEAYADRTGFSLDKPGFARHPDHYWMVATPDRQVRDDGRVVELKTANAFAAGEWGEPGTDAIPDYYVLQVQHQMAVTGARLADVAVLIGGSDFRVYTVERNDRLILTLIDIERDFWSRVERREPPEPDWLHASTPSLVAALFGVKEVETVELGAEAAELVADYDRLGLEEKEAKAARAVVKAKLLFEMRTAAKAFLPDGTVLTRKQVHRKAYSVPASTYTDFRVKKAKATHGNSDTDDTTGADAGAAQAAAG